MSFASDSSETVEAIVVKLGTVTAKSNHYIIIGVGFLEMVKPEMQVKIEESTVATA